MTRKIDSNETVTVHEGPPPELYDPKTLMHEDAAGRTILRVARNLTMQGLSGATLQSALLTSVGLHSSHFANPLGLLFISDLPAGNPDKILQSALVLTCPSIIEHASTLSKKILSDRVGLQKHLTGKAVVSFDAKVDHQSLRITTSMLSAHTGAQTLVAPSVVAISKSPKDPLREDSSLLSMVVDPVDASSDGEAWHDAASGSHEYKQLIQTDCYVLRKDILAAPRGSVVIPYQNQITTSMLKAGSSRAEIDVVLKVIRIITQMNAPPSAIDVLADYYCVPRADAEIYLLRCKGLKQLPAPLMDRQYQKLLPTNEQQSPEGTVLEHIPVDEDGGFCQPIGRGHNLLVATKVDYYYAHHILVGAAREGSGLAILHTRIMHAIWKDHMDYVLGSTWIKKDPSMEELFQVIHAPDNSKCWPTLYRIVDLTKQDGGPPLKCTDIHRGLNYLVNTVKCISKKSVPGADGGPRYQALYLPTSSRTRMPDPSVILDPARRTTRVEVLHPITWKAETI